MSRNFLVRQRNDLIFFLNFLNNDTELLFQFKLNYELICSFKYRFLSVNNYFIYRDKSPILTYKKMYKTLQIICMIRSSKFLRFWNSFSIPKTNNDPFNRHKLLKQRQSTQKAQKFTQTSSIPSKKKQMCFQILNDILDSMKSSKHLNKITLRRC